MTIITLILFLPFHLFIFIRDLDSGTLTPGRPIATSHFVGLHLRLLGL